MPFNLETIYGLSRADYCELTGITPQELISHLEAEISALTYNYDRLSAIYRNGDSVANNEQRERAKLLTVIIGKIDSKREKVNDIKNEFGL